MNNYNPGPTVVVVIEVKKPYVDISMTKDVVVIEARKAAEDLDVSIMGQSL